MHTNKNEWETEPTFSIKYVYLRLRGEWSHELNLYLSYWLSLLICIKLKDSERCRIAGHASSGRQWSPEIASSQLKWMGSCHFVAESRL